MELEMNDALSVTVERLGAAAAMLEQAVAALDAKQEFAVEKIVATVAAGRETELERKLAEAEATIAALRASAEVRGRKTVLAAGADLLAKHGVSEGMDVSTLDAALVSLSLEQRIAVKSQLMRAGLV